MDLLAYRVPALTEALAGLPAGQWRYLMPYERF